MPYADPERQREYLRAYRRAHPDKRQRQRDRRAYMRAYHQALHLEALNAYGGPVCARCDSTGRLQLDHVNGDGAQHRRSLTGSPRGRGAHVFYSALKRLGWPNDPPLQVLCAPCNRRKQHAEDSLKDSPPAPSAWYNPADTNVGRE